MAIEFCVGAVCLFDASVLAAQNAPSLKVTTILYVPADSAQLPWWSNLLVDKRGMILGERLIHPMKDGVNPAMVVVFNRKGERVQFGPGPQTTPGSAQGWVGSRDRDVIWMGDTLGGAHMLNPGHTVARSMALLDIAEKLPDSTAWWMFSTRAVYSDGTALADVYRMDSTAIAFGGESAAGRLVRLDSAGHWLRSVVTFPQTAHCRGIDRNGKRFIIDGCSTMTFGVSPSGNRIAIVRLESDQREGFAVIALSETGDTVFHRHFAFPVDSLPSQLAAQRLRRIDSIAAPASRATLIVPMQRRSFTKVLVSDEGAVWIDLDFSDIAPHRWVQVDARGRLVGIAIIPTGARPSVAINDELWAVQRGNDFQSGLIGFRISRP